MASSALERGTSLRRAREQQAWLELILRAICPGFAEYGFDRATMEMIAEQAEIGKATLYNLVKHARGGAKE